MLLRRVLRYYLSHTLRLTTPSAGGIRPLRAGVARSRRLRALHLVIGVPLPIRPGRRSSRRADGADSGSDLSNIKWERARRSMRCALRPTDDRQAVVHD